MNFEDYAAVGDVLESGLTIHETLNAESDLPEVVTAEDIEVDRQILVSRYGCHDHEISYDFVRLPREVYSDPENNYGKYSAIILQYTLKHYSGGVLINKIISDRIVAVPEHITTRAIQLKQENKLAPGLIDG